MHRLLGIGLFFLRGLETAKLLSYHQIPKRSGCTTDRFHKATYATLDHISSSNAGEREACGFGDMQFLSV